MSVAGVMNGKQLKLNSEMGTKEETEPMNSELESRQTEKKRKTYLKLDTTGLDEYLNKASIMESVKQGVRISKTAYIQALIKADMEQRKDI